MAKKKPIKKKAVKAKKIAHAAKPKKKVSTRKKKARIENRRQYRRVPATTLWVTEHSGEYVYTFAAANISEGGIFLKGRLKTAAMPSQLRIPLGNAGEALELTARPLHDRLFGESCGTGYEFLEVSPIQRKSLRALLRDLN